MAITLPVLLSDDELTTIENLSACNYSPEKIALYLSIDKKAFLQVWYDNESLLRIAYERGKMVAEFEIMNKQLELSKSGNITAAQIYLKESKEQEVNNIRNKILFGDDY